MAEKQHVFLVGAKSLGAYGGYETFIDKLTEYHQDNKNIQYHVAVKANGQGHMDETKVDAKIISGSRFIYHNADCFKIHVPEKLGPAQAIYYDCKALDKCVEIIKEEGIKHPIVYIMACRIGPFMKKYYKAIHRLDGKVYLNPDGHEWMRAKWSDPVRKYWKVSEQMMVKYSDLAVCDSVNIEKYIHEQYDGKGIRGKNPKTTFIAYGAETRKSLLADDDKNLLSWYEQKGLKPKAYYLVVGRFVPENNYETMIREFMKSKTKKDFAIITNVNDSNIVPSVAPNDKIIELHNSLVKDNMKLMSYFGFINEYKCFLELVEAIKHLKDAGKLKSKLVVIGELKESDEYHKKVLEKIREYNLDNDIIVTGYLKDSVGDYLKASDFAVLPFYYGISVRNGSFLAAYQEGIDIITTKGDKNFPYDDVYLMNDNTPQTIASAIEYMQDNSLKSEHRKIDFYWDDISKQHVELYEKIYG